MKKVSEQNLNCLKNEKKQLRDAVRQCDFCSTSMAGHSDCYAETACESGRRSKNCFD
ncbi:MAG: hypothetical protein JJV98_03050 [Desulfosarcina sp.]|nr:hypothetical protein [Desulfobacterales bacterium]